ncbi:hypothetical protein TNCV_4202801 [Trichonephila clavipes]|uniref:Uncharacterized protein n=1 Tax=Trichonephila clavipes TaxID=2585209 RepID=A0A8X6VBZ9_TRICX|nr:hypothetical protein TNCV_4202801 [Trichonephila clavipes]
MNLCRTPTVNYPARLRERPYSSAVFNLHGTLGTSNCCAPFHYFQSTPFPVSKAPPSLLQFLPYQFWFGRDFHLTFLLFLCLLNMESFHYPPPMDPPRPGLATGSRKE